MDWLGKRVFITGASGLLGSNLTEALIAEGAEVTVLIRDWVPESRLFREEISMPCNVIRGDVRDYDLLVRVLNEYDIQMVFHLAAQTQVTYAKRSPLETLDTNIMGTSAVLEAVRNCEWIEKVMIASSDKAYGNAPSPYSESTPLQGRYPYDCSKSCVDLIAQSYIETYSTKAIITRCANLFGEGDLNFERLIPGTIKSILENKPPVIRSDGSMIREFLYVKDAVDAYLKLAESDCVGAFNIGHSVQLSVLTVVNKIMRAMRFTGGINIKNTASSEILRQGLDSSKLINELGWSPRYGFDEGLKRTIDWYRSIFDEGSR